jgi:hypothetical protein
MRRGNTKNGGYKFIPAGDGRGVWTPGERSAHGSAVRAAQATKAAEAEAAMQASIDAINADVMLTQQQKVSALGRLTASGYSREEFAMLAAAREEAKALL